MGYKNDSVMDTGYFIGHPEGLIYFPPPGSDESGPSLIPWSELLDEVDEPVIVDEQASRDL